MTYLFLLVLPLRTERVDATKRKTTSRSYANDQLRLDGRYNLHLSRTNALLQPENLFVYDASILFVKKVTCETESTVAVHYREVFTL
jgi:hypothetical protein